jgi:hypothetical protein
MSHDLLIVDPLTLVGRELLICLDDRPQDVSLSFVHTSADDEHQIAELAGEAGLVPPLDDLAALDRADVIVVASDEASDRLEQLARWVDERPASRVVDLGRTATMRELTRAWAGGPLPDETTHFRAAHPAVAAALRLQTALESVGHELGHLVAVDPVSHGGREPVERLARQAASRLQGHAVTETIGGHVLAFALVAVDADDLQRDADAVLGAGWSVDRSLVGCFHGHAAHIVVDLAEAIDPSDLRDQLAAAPGLELRDRPLALDQAPDSDAVLVASSRLAADGRRFSTLLMMDGLRVGGAMTGLELIERLI